MATNLHEALSLPARQQHFNYTDTQTLLYNLSIGMGQNPMDAKELPFVSEHANLKTVPTAATVVGMSPSRLLEGLTLDRSRLLHAEHRLTLHRTLPPSGQLVSTTRFREIVDKGREKGALINTEIDVHLTSGERVCTMNHVTFARGDGGFGGTAQSSFSPHSLPQRTPDITHLTNTQPNQALLYRLNGDRYPVHADPDFAARAGFPMPILHGLCSYGIACRALLASLCNYVPSRMKSFDVRFTAPVFPGESIHTDIWLDGSVASFRCRVPDREAVILNNGRCELEP